MKTDYATYREVLRTMPTEPYRTPVDIDCRTTPNVGELMAAELAAAGLYVRCIGGRTACETDYLVESGKTFPPNVTYEQMVDFNRRTLKPIMEEAEEVRRYKAIAEFWRQ